MDSVVFNFVSTRAKKARFSRFFNKLVRIVLIVAMVLLFALGVYMLFVGITMGWLVASLAVIPGAMYQWWRGDLRNIPIIANAQSIDGVLDSNILAKLPQAPTPKDVATAVMQVNGGQFFAVRFGIGPAFLQETASENPQDTAAVWQAALEAKNEVGVPNISGAILVVALTKTQAAMAQVLPHLQLDNENVTDGARWYHRIQHLIEEQKKPRRTGGFGRDWSFGYIPYLKRFGQNISDQIVRGGLMHVQLEAHEKALEQMLTTFGSGGRQNVTLVGPAGAGKTTLVHAFAQKLIEATPDVPQNLHFRQIISLDPSALISAAPGRGELEGLVNRVLVEAYKAKNIIVCLDDAQLFFEEGVGSVDLSNLLLPILEGGGLRLVLTMDEQRWLQISQRNPALANVLNRVMITPATEEETLRVMQDNLIITEFQRKVTFMYQALLEAFRLSERYVHELSMPGRALRLLESASGYAEDGMVTAKSVQQAIEQTLDIKVGVASGEDEREKLLNLEQLIHERMINQSRAVNVVSDALRRARSGVRNQSRPIGTFLFLGPTGVGKTELSKALADVYFGGEDRLVRLDLNEYVGADDVTRLIADGSQDPHSLTAQVMKQPFSVILLDEIEKAHPNVLATLLQLLDEGILRDIRNREVSFRDAIVIATSNAGADRIRQYIDAGYELEQFEEQFTNELIQTQQFRPEFLNRFDEIVVFRPLSKEELLQVIDLILKSVNRNLALQKISVEVAQDAKIVLVDAGYDPRLGARPMRRVVQRTVENLIAKRMLAGNVTPGETIQITKNDIEEALRS